MLSVGGPSLHLGKYAGIPVKVHWTFSLLIVFVSYIAVSNEIPRGDLIWFYSYVILLFVFVILHEYGHALTARKYGISTRDIIISPIGGIARLERLPENPKHELLIAVAGPAVNVVLAFLFLVVQILTADFILPQGEDINFGSPSDFIGYLLIINIVLVVFNMVPAFPMDGGRVLRAILTMLTKDRFVATKWAVWIGQAIATAFLVGGILWDQYMLIFIGIFVFLTARAEFKQMKLIDRMNSATVGDIMSKEFTLLKPDDPLKKAIAIKNEFNFLVADYNQNIVGALPHLFIRQAIKEKQEDMLVGDRMTSSYGTVLSSNTLSQVFKLLNDRGWAIAQVVDTDGNKKGVIDRQLLMDFIRRV